MKIINNINNTKPTRLIITCNKNEAFRLGGNNWYTRVEMHDFCLRSAERGDGREFVKEHALYGHENASPIALTPCIHLSSMSLVYIDGNRTAEEWATITATLTTP